MKKNILISFLEWVRGRFSDPLRTIASQDQGLFPEKIYMWEGMLQIQRNTEM